MPPTVARPTNAKIPVLIRFLILDLGGRFISMNSASSHFGVGRDKHIAGPEFLESCTSHFERAAMGAGSLFSERVMINFPRNYTVLRHGTNQGVCQQSCGKIAPPHNPKIISILA